MLKSLNISNFAVIDKLHVIFHPGLNVLTGETGSGKSIIVDAVSLLMGGRSSSTQIRSGESHAVIEGVFELPEEKSVDARAVLGELDIAEGPELVIRREIHSGGRGKILLNQKSASVGSLRKLQPFLSKIYGQGEHRSLLSAQSHRELLDNFGQCLTLRNEVQRAFLKLKSAERELKELVKNSAERERSMDLLQHQLNEISSIKPEVGEDEKLLAERKKLAHSERIIELCSAAYNELYESDESVLSRLGLIRRRIEELGGFMEEAASLLVSLQEATAALSDVAEALRSYVSGAEHSPDRLAEVEYRLAELEKLKRKYAMDLSGILRMRGEIQAKLTESGQMEERLNNLGAETSRLRREYIEKAEKLSSCRRASAPLLEQQVKEGLSHVAMSDAQFLVSIETCPAVEDEAFVEVEESTSLEGLEDFSESSFYTQNGADYVEFFLSANPGESPRPLSDVASGGELSRLMLTLRTIGKSDETNETIIFDEIDVGIGGRVAQAVGQRLKALSATGQVFCVTHQAQIAKFADNHFVVTKSIEKGRTVTNIKRLTKGERVGELARMIGGNDQSTKTLEAAQWLLENT